MRLPRAAVAEFAVIGKILIDDIKALLLLSPFMLKFKLFKELLRELLLLLLRELLLLLLLLILLLFKFALPELLLLFRLLVTSLF